MCILYIHIYIYILLYNTYIDVYIYMTYTYTCIYIVYIYIYIHIPGHSLPSTDIHCLADPRHSRVVQVGFSLLSLHRGSRGTSTIRQARTGPCKMLIWCDEFQHGGLWVRSSVSCQGISLLMLLLSLVCFNHPMWCRCMYTNLLLLIVSGCRWCHSLYV